MTLTRMDILTSSHTFRATLLQKKLIVSNQKHYYIEIGEGQLLKIDENLGNLSGTQNVRYEWMQDWFSSRTPGNTESQYVHQ